MISRWPLRIRVALTYALIGFLLSIVFAVTTTEVAEQYELILIGAVLDGQAHTWQERLHDDPSVVLPVSDRLAAYREEDAPAEVQGLGDGVHDLDLPGREGVHAAVYGNGPHRLVVLIDVGRIEDLEDYLFQVMIAVVIGGTLLSGLLGWLLAHRAILPARQLAQAVESLPLRPLPTKLAGEFADDEIGRLAGAIDGYQQRLVDVDTAERGFFANASHELRTPIAVIQGAVEVMKDDPAIAAGQAQRLGRIDRAMLELGSLLEALLLSARGLPPERETLDLRERLRDALARIAAAEPEALTRVAVLAGAPLPVTAPQRWVDCILTVLLQRLLSKAPGTYWQVALTDNVLLLRQPDAGAAGERVQRSDLGINLIFVERLCRGLDWRLEQAIDGDGRLSIALVVRPAA